MGYNGKYKCSTINAIEDVDGTSKVDNYIDVIGTGLSLGSIFVGTLVYSKEDCNGIPMVPICMIGICHLFYLAVWFYI